jgi:hypothetical protein
LQQTWKDLTLVSVGVFMLTPVIAHGAQRPLAVEAAR